MLTVLVLVSMITPPVSAAPSGVASSQFLPTRYTTLSDVKVFLKLFATNDGLHVSSVVWQDPLGATTSCNPGGACATTYEYAPNGVVISGTWEFYISEKGRSTGRYTAVVTYCSNYSGSSCLSWSTTRPTFYISPESQPPVIATVPVTGIARGIGINPTTDRIYVANSDSSVSVLDGVSSTVVATVSVGSNPTGVGVNPVTNRIYVSNVYSDTVSVIDGASNTLVVTVPVGTSPMGVGVNPTTNRIYVANEYVDTVSVIDGTSNTVIATVAVGIGPRGVGVNPATNRIYVANEYTHNVSVIDGASNTLITTVPVTAGAYPLNLAVNPATNRIYVGSSEFNTIAVIDGASNTVIATLPVGTRTHWYIGVNPTTNHIYLPDDLAVTVMDGATNTVLGSVPFGRPATYIGINPTTNRVYVANNDGNSVVVIQDELSGTPGYTSSPVTGSTLDVGQVRVGLPVTATLTISESGDAVLNVTGHSLSGLNAADFSVSPATLSISDGGAAQSLSIRCAPGALGLRTASLTVSFNATGSPAVYPLNCTGQTTVYLPLLLQPAP